MKCRSWCVQKVQCPSAVICLVPSSKGLYNMSCSSLNVYVFCYCICFHFQPCCGQNLWGRNSHCFAVLVINPIVGVYTPIRIPYIKRWDDHLQKKSGVDRPWHTHNGGRARILWNARCGQWCSMPCARQTWLRVVLMRCGKATYALVLRQGLQQQEEFGHLFF